MFFNKYQLSSVAMSSFLEYTKTTHFEMKVNFWMSITLSVSIGIANAFELPICPSNEEIYLPHPDNCEQFYICQNGLAYPAACLSGMQWNQTQGQCIHSDGDNSCQKRTQTIICPLEEDPSIPKHIPNEHDCGQFYTCFGGAAYQMACPAGKHWSVELNRCEHPSVANCQRRQSRSVIQNGDINPDCPLDDDPRNPTILRYPGDCVKFYKCSYGRSYVMSCPFGLHWDVSSNQCESPFIAKCRSGGGTTTRRTTTQSPTETTRWTPFTTTRAPPENTRWTLPTTTRIPDPNLPGPVPQCSDKNSVQKFGIPGECNWFMQCYNGNAFRIKCREGREWSTIRNDCIAAALAGCSSSPGSDSSSQFPTVTIPATTSTTSIPTSCDEGVEFLRHSTDCHKYIQCDNGNPLEKECPASLYFSRKMKRCEWTSKDC